MWISNSSNNLCITIMASRCRKTVKVELVYIGVLVIGFSVFIRLYKISQKLKVSAYWEKSSLRNVRVNTIFHLIANYHSRILILTIYFQLALLYFIYKFHRFMLYPKIFTPFLLNTCPLRSSIAQGLPRIDQTNSPP